MHHGRVLSCSCASGPAFEGAHIRDGMRAAPGRSSACTSARIAVRPVTIAGQPAVGICGSGILNAVAEMLDAHILDERGVLQPGGPRACARPTARPSSCWCRPAQTGHGRDIVVTRKDVNEIQLAKGAIRAGLEILLKEAGIAAEAVDDFIIAGAFGTHLDLNSALRVGMFPRAAAGALSPGGQRRRGGRAPDAAFARAARRKRRAMTQRGGIYRTDHLPRIYPHVCGQHVFCVMIQFKLF